MSFEPVFDSACRILILGTTPSPASREAGFYYGHPQNRFWPLLARLVSAEPPETVEAKKALLLEHHIALWDVLESCDIVGAADSTIANPVPNDLGSLAGQCRLRAVYANGKAAWTLCRRFWTQDIVRLPSTSPANAAWDMDRLAKAWACVTQTLSEGAEHGI